MDVNNVPQDESSTYASMKKAIYAMDEDGKVKSVASTGWDVEEIATKVALDDIDKSIKEAYEEVKSGVKSPLYYHMYVARMDLLVLAQSTGFFQWKIKRDFKPSVFKKQSDKRLLEYCNALGITLEELKVLPEVIDE
jgi:hypothetical protein